MATSEQRDLRQTSLEYVLLGETVDKDGNEVDLLVVAELRKRDNFRMQRRNGQKGRSLRPSPRELKGLYRDGLIKFADGGEKRFRDAMRELNVDLDSDDVAPARKAPSRPSSAGADSSLQAMTVAQLREMLKGMGGSIYAGGRQKNKTALIASIEELRGGNKSDSEKDDSKKNAPKKKATKTSVTDVTGDVSHSSPAVSVVDVDEKPEQVAVTRNEGKDKSEDKMDLTWDAPETVASDISEFDTLVTVRDFASADGDSVDSSHMEEDDASDIKPMEVEEDDLITPMDVTNGGFGKSVTPSLSFEDEPDNDFTPTIDFDAEEPHGASENGMRSETEDVETPESDVSISTDIDEEPMDDDIDIDEMFAEIADMSDDDDAKDEEIADSAVTETSVARKRPSILFNIPSDEDERIDIINEDEEEEAEEETKVVAPRRPHIVIPSRRNRRNVPRRRQPTVSDTGSFMSPVSIVDKISFGNNDKQVDEETGDTAYDDIDAILSQPTTDADLQMSDNWAENEEPIANSIPDDSEEGSNSIVETDEASQDDENDGADSTVTNEDEDDLIDIFDDLDNEGIKTSDDLMDALYSPNSTEDEQSDGAVSDIPSYSGFEFAWSDKSDSSDIQAMPQGEDSEQPGTDFIGAIVSNASEDDGIDLTDFDDLDDDLFDSDLSLNYGSSEQIDSSDKQLNGDVPDDLVGFPVQMEAAGGNERLAYGTAAEPEDSEFESQSPYGEGDNLGEPTDELSIDVTPKDGYPASKGTNRGLNKEDRTLIRKTFKRMLLEVLIIAIIAIAGIAWLMANGVAIFPGIPLP